MSTVDTGERLSHRRHGKSGLRLGVGDVAPEKSENRSHSHGDGRHPPGGARYAPLREGGVDSRQARQKKLHAASLTTSCASTFATLFSGRSSRRLGLEARSVEPGVEA
jgi:hypothetical protein